MSYNAGQLPGAVSPFTIIEEQSKRIAELETLLRELRREHKDCCCSKCEDITARIDAALRSTKTEGDARPLVLHESQRYLVKEGWVEGRDYVMSERLPQSMGD